MPEDSNDVLSAEDFSALYQAQQQLQAAGDPRAEKLRVFISTSGRNLLHPEEQRNISTLGRLWESANRGLVSKDTFVRALTGMTPQQLDSALAWYPDESPVHSAIREFVRGTSQDIGETASSFTSPVAIGTMAAGAAGKIPGAVGKVARALTAGSSAAFGAQGAAEILSPSPETETTPEALKRRLQGAAMVAGGAAGVGASLAGAKPPSVAGVKETLAETLRPSPRAAQRLVPGAANLPPKALTGAENLFRAAAPTGGNPQFRANLYTAAGDLAEIGRKIDISRSKGGIRRPDFRVRDAVNAVNDHLHEMYLQERLPQIQRNAQAQVLTTFDADAAAGLKHIRRVAPGEANKNLAQRVLSSETVSLADLDQLARVVNKELVDLNSMTASERALKLGTNDRLFQLQVLDRQLKGKINAELVNRGEVGVTNYEKRFASLSEFRDQLQTRMNAVELQRKIPGAGLIRSLTGGKSGIASASQAAVADVNIGRSLQTGFRLLKESGIKPDRGVAAPARQVKGLLGPGAIQLGEALEPISPGPEGLLPAERVTVRDPRTGKMRRQFVTSPKR